ncbi:MAG: hypothetical protein Q8S13_12795, partial [Dehalococcoidia bacterium]|nr:hypothetical protein [Dehalococcoidia bacterium]
MTTITERLTTALADRYVIERELGAGGMATVYLAHDVRHDRKVALKVLRPELSAIVGAERFLAEIKTTANLQHLHILSLFDSSGDAGPGHPQAMTDDWFEVLHALLDADAKFLVIGAHAMAVHGVPRGTQDLDVWVEPSSENADKVWRALAGFGAPLHSIGV